MGRILWELQASGVSLNRLAFIFGMDRKTVVRKVRGLAGEARIEHEAWQRKEAKRTKRKAVQFDDLETAEHTKCKPVSVALAVDPETRKILSFQVSRMPAKGLLAAISRRKYGYRRDERPDGWNRLMEELKPMVAPDVEILSDQNPHYPHYVRKHLPESIHKTVKGQRGCVSGQGELKKIGHDPLFALNHTCAMFRANVNRLFRKTWCISKTIQGLQDHLILYTVFHNQRLTQKERKMRRFRLTA